MPPRRLPNLPVSPVPVQGGHRRLTRQQREDVAEQLHDLRDAVTTHLRATDDLTRRVATSLERGATHAQVADVLGMSETAVSQWVMRSRQRNARNGGGGSLVKVEPVVFGAIRAAR
jgi:hypothetical protein